ncbi:MAG: DUF427 domain-containing protein [Pseudomonadota bacterium]
MAKIEIQPTVGTVVVRAGGAVIAESTAALTLLEEGYAPVHYLPRNDAGMAFLEASDKRTTCPHKGEAEYFHVMGKSQPIRDAAWSYATPIAGMEAIAGFVAFDAERMAVEIL